MFSAILCGKTELLKASFKLDHFFPLLEKPADFRYLSGGREKSEKTEGLSRPNWKKVLP
jgi:hypothetical protein